MDFIIDNTIAYWENKSCPARQQSLPVCVCVCVCVCACMCIYIYGTKVPAS